MKANRERIKRFPQKKPKLVTNTIEHHLMLPLLLLLAFNTIYITRLIVQEACEVSSGIKECLLLNNLICSSLPSGA